MNEPKSATQDWFGVFVFRLEPADDEGRLLGGTHENGDGTPYINIFQAARVGIPQESVGTLRNRCRAICAGCMVWRRPESTPGAGVLGWTKGRTDAFP
jgi:hypothetical protein